MNSGMKQHLDLKRRLFLGMVCLTLFLSPDSSRRGPSGNRHQRLCQIR